MSTLSASPRTREGRLARLARRLSPLGRSAEELACHALRARFPDGMERGRCSVAPHRSSVGPHGGILWPRDRVTRAVWLGLQPAEVSE